MTGSERIGHYELYVFDWDGTVMDTTALIARGMQEAAKALSLPIPDYDVCRGTIGLSNPQAMAVGRILAGLPQLVFGARSRSRAFSPSAGTF